MPIFRCPNCAQISATGPTAGDYNHTCDSGKEVLDNDSIVEIRKPNFNFQGKADKSSIAARILGIKIPQVNKQGDNKATHYQRQHFEHIELDGPQNTPPVLPNANSDKIV